ncbi:MAG: DnaB-like helicase C-terminal domain-containing protein [Hyphomicrobiales bacterium]
MSCSKGECPCGTSSDAFATYDDGSTWCFRCENKNVPKGFKGTTKAKPDDAPEEDGNWTPVQGWTEALIARGITEETCKKFSYQIGKDKHGNRVHIQNIKEGGRLTGQKFRTKDKDFFWIGPAAKDPGITGSWMWPSDGRRVCITEGEIDMMSFAQAFDLKYHWGSLPNGTGSVEKAILKDYEKLCAFEEIYLSFDDDEPGRKALKKACELLPVGKVKIISLPKNDANAVLTSKEHGPATLVRAFWDAKLYRPDGIREGREFTKERLKQKKAKGYTMPWPRLNSMWLGSRDGELTTICAGSGIGKTTIVRDLAYHMRVEHGLKIGNIYLEEDNDTSAAAYCALHAGVPLKNILNDPECITDDQWDAALAAVVHDGMMFYDHFGSLESERLMTMMRYMAASGCKRIVLDHISIVTSGLESGSEGERKDIDILMTKLASFVKETGCSVYAIVHLKRSQGKNFNEGGQISLNDMRGSASIEQLSFNVLAVERDQQNEEEKLFAVLRSLKCRITGETGEADRLKWNREKGRYEIASAFNTTPDFDPHEKSEEKDIVF